MLIDLSTSTRWATLFQKGFPGTDQPCQFQGFASTSEERGGHVRSDVADHLRIPRQNAFSISLHDLCGRPRSWKAAELFGTDRERFPGGDQLSDLFSIA